MLEVDGEPICVGALIAGTYRLERSIGEGGMGEVWAARDTDGKVVALKIARAERGDRKQVERMLREARAASLVRHPNVAPLLAVVETDTGLPCLVMPLLVGESLRALLTRRGALPWPECVRLFSGIVAGLRAVHAAALVHRDLKPENVHTEGEHAVVLDFGIAKEVVAELGETVSPSLTSTGVIVGTPFYMAPEQIYGERDIDARADVWALGLMLYEALSGVLPTRADGFGQVLKRVTTSDFASLSSIVPNLPEPLSRLVAIMLSRDRAARPPLEAVASTLATLASPAVNDRAPEAADVAKEAIVAHAPSAGAPRAMRVRVVGAIGLLVVIAGAFGYTRRSPSPSGLAAVPTGGSAGTEASVPVRPSSDLAPTSALPSGALDTLASAAPSATPPKPHIVAPAVSSAKATQHVVFDTMVGSHSGMGPEITRLFAAVQASLPKLRSCFPAPTDDLAWSANLRIYWPKNGPRFAHATPVKNGTSQEPAAESAIMVSCLERMLATFEIPAATGQDENDGGAAYLVASAGYRWRFGPAP